MMKTLCRGWRPPVLLGAGLVIAFAASLGVQAGDQPKDNTGKTSKEVETQVHASLRNVINQGADLYNISRDYAGCYHTFKGGLIAVRPLLDGHPDLQKLIDKSIQDAELNPRMWQRAFTLRTTLDTIRTRLDPAGGKTPGGEKKPDGEKKPEVDKKSDGDKKPVDDKKADADKKKEDKKVDDKKPADDKKVDDKKPAEDKKVDDKKAEDKKPSDKKSDLDKKSEDKKPADDKKAEDKKSEEKKDGDLAQISGKVTYKGKALTAGFVTLVGKDQRKFSANLTADGVYTFKKGIPPGEYVIILEPAAGTVEMVVPERYRNPDLTPLQATLVKGSNQLPLELE